MNGAVVFKRLLFLSFVAVPFVVGLIVLYWSLGVGCVGEVERSINAPLIRELSDFYGICDGELEVGRDYLRCESPRESLIINCTGECAIVFVPKASTTIDREKGLDSLRETAREYSSYGNRP